MKKTPFILSIMFVVFLIVVFSTVFSGPENVDVVSGNGRIEATEIGISAKVAGRVEEIYVSEGDRVTAGDVVANLIPPPLIASFSRPRHSTSKPKVR